jgi:asparagine synthase (glutamine-hydrolysing)
VRELLSPPSLRESGLFDPIAVGQLVKKADAGMSLGETDDMALAGILSSQLVHHQFVKSFSMPPPLGQRDDVKVCSRATVAKGT